MNKYGVHIFLLMAVLSAGCSTESELRKSIFIYDKDHPGLPVYSEWGYNTFGAYYDRTPFTSNYTVTPAKFIVENETSAFRLEGEKQSASHMREKIVAMFILPEILPDQYSDLIELHQRSFDLTSPGTNVLILIDDKEASVEILEGQIHFVRAQNLLVDTQQTQIILSGRFGFKAVVDGVPVSVSDGRFDVGINDKNFFRF